MYVSVNTGDNEKDGLSPGTPLSSLDAAMVKLQGDKNLKEIRLCAGTYTLADTLEVPEGVKLSGGYDCNFQAQDTTSATALCKGDVPNNITVLQGATPVLRLKEAGGQTISTLHLKGKAKTVVELLGADATLERNRIYFAEGPQAEPTRGLRIEGGTPTLSGNCIQGGAGVAGNGNGNVQAASIGVEIIKGSKALLQNDNEIEGGQGQAGDKGSGSVGLFVTNSSPRIIKNVFRGGPGTSNLGGAFGSVGLVINSTADSNDKITPEISQNDIRGGGGTHLALGTGSVGLLLRCTAGCPGIKMDGTLAIADNTIDGGQGKSPPGAIPRIGVHTQGENGKGQKFEVALIRNFISGGDAQTDAPDKFGPRGIYMSPSGGLIARNSIFGGGGKAGDSAAVEAHDIDALDIQNNMIHAGSVENQGGTSEAIHYGIVGEMKGSLQIRHNTIVVAPNQAHGWGIWLQNNPNGFNSLSDGNIDNNILLGSGNKASHGIVFGGCPNTYLGSLKGNAFVMLGMQAIFHQLKDGGCLGNSNPSTGGGYNPDPDTTCPGSCNYQNVDVDGLCTNATKTCVKILSCTTDQDKCGQALFSNWSNGVSEVKSEKDKGWQLKPDLPCQLTRNKIVLPDAALDRYNVSHSEIEPARGAHEQGVCAGGG